MRQREPAWDDQGAGHGQPFAVDATRFDVVTAARYTWQTSPAGPSILSTPWSMLRRVLEEREMPYVLAVPVNQRVSATVDGAVAELRADA